MNRLARPRRAPVLPLAALALLASAFALPVHAASTASVSVSDSVSTALGSVSDSLHRSSESSTGNDRRAQGEYRIVAIAEVPERPGMMRLTLQAQTPAPDAADELQLDLPRTVVDGSALVTGQTVSARPRPYGIEFARFGGAAFFLVLDDAWFRDLPSRPVVL